MPLSPTETRAALEQIGHSPNKKLGQNFLIDGNIVRKSIDMAAIQPGDAIVEVGPGLGTLTRSLLETGAEVWAVERDAVLSGHLARSLAPEYPDRLHFIEGDALAHPLADLPPERAESGFKIVANLPYAISTPWMDAVLSGPLPQQMVLMLQKEAADRYAANHGSKSFGAISIFLQAAYAISGRHPVSAHCFHPVPKIDSTLLHLSRRPEPVRFSEAAKRAIRFIFTQRRKQLGSLCRQLNEPAASRWFAQQTAEGLGDTVRPEDVELRSWLQLQRFL